MVTGKQNLSRFCCFKLRKMIEKLSNEQPMNAITKCTLAGLVQYAKSHRFEVVHAYLAQHCFFLPLPHVEFKMLLVPAGGKKRQKRKEKRRDHSLHKGNTGSQTMD